MSCSRCMKQFSTPHAVATPAKFQSASQHPTMSRGTRRSRNKNKARVVIFISIFLILSISIGGFYITRLQKLKIHQAQVDNARYELYRAQEEATSLGERVTEADYLSSELLEKYNDAVAREFDARDEYARVLAEAMKDGITFD